MPIEMEKVLFEEPAKRFKVSLSFIQRLLKRYREEGTIAPKTLGGGPTPQLEPHTEQIHLLLEQCNDLTLEQLGQKLAQETDPVGECATKHLTSSITNHQSKDFSLL